MGSRFSSAFGVFVAVFLAFVPGRAAAYPWMVHHGYTSCAQCHVDPSGAGVLTDYGRAQGEILLRSHYGGEQGDVEKTSAFLFGVVELPKALELQADVRGLVIPEPGNIRAILMQADVRGAVTVGPVTASGSIGAVSDGAQLAQVSSNDGGWNLVSREYWAGVTPTRGLTVRAGRMNLPFGIRTEDHILYTRSATGTTINADQQVGLAVAYGNRRLRGEIMGIAGNFQVAPDEFRKRGYSGYLAWMPSKTFEVGVSSLYTVSKLDVETLAQRGFQAHGLFLRTAPIPQFAILAEGDLLLDNQAGTSLFGLASSAILDYEPVQGLHVQGIGEYCDPDFSNSDSPAWMGSAAAQWFFTSRLDVRVDAGYGVLKCVAGAAPSPIALVQGHFYL